MDAPFLIELVGGRYDGELRALPEPRYEFRKLCRKCWRPVADVDSLMDPSEWFRELRYVNTMRTRGNIHIFALVE